ncbi:AAA family ATPase, partial [Providencia rettgeri]|nr:AAA family ATPase [Providencia rettgeri]
MFYIIGPRGSGKTTIGKKLAESKGYQFVDTDKLILERAGKTIAEIVEQY